MKKISVREQGLVGTLFSSGTPKSAIILLGGSSGGINESRAERLAAHGFAAFALAYFGCETLPPTLNRIPLEYFQKAMQWMHDWEGIERIGIWGGSRGAEASLILGTLFPDQIQAIAAHVPTSVVYGAIDDQSAPAWTYRGEPIAPNAPFIEPNVSNTALGLDQETAIALTPCFLGGMEDKNAFARAAIPVEKIRCPLLLISAEDDQMWPSTIFAKQIVERLNVHRSPIPCTHHSYPRVGHAPSAGTAGLHPIIKRWFTYGGNPTDNEVAAHDWWDKTIEFFQTDCV
ncbi:MAG TPA: acyl-CoA thioester hydrolase/BAAT C-terminal domain-containing protein [Chlamydiales bacterium]|nr:acyl-CoA thioester hydrolase/BAAT C-terminal domain-containing protein [Chlamydiales bacterium]